MTVILEPRRRPTQERSRVKFERLLEESRDLLLEVGFESFTCEEVAHRAEVPIGTLYQFFANKYVIICELDRQNAVAVREELAKLAAELPTLDWLRLLNRLLDHMATMWLDDPSRSAVWYAVQSTPATRATAEVTEAELAADVAYALGPLTPGTSRERRKIMAEVLVHVAYSMLNFAIRNRQDYDEALVEAKRLLSAYLLAAEASGANEAATSGRKGAKENQ